VNLLPEKEKNDLKKGLKTRLIVAVLFLFSATIIFGALSFLPAYFLASGNIAETESINKSLNVSKNNENLSEFLILPEKIKQRLTFFKSSLINTSVLKILDEIIKVKPSGISVSSISFSRERDFKEKRGTLVLVSGLAKDRESLIDFSANLKKSIMFSFVEIPVSNLTRDKNLPFSLNIFIEN
jgi:Tfp pilus assembly protein PilN